MSFFGCTAIAARNTMRQHWEAAAARYYSGYKLLQVSRHTDAGHCTALDLPEGGSSPAAEGAKLQAPFSTEAPSQTPFGQRRKSLVIALVSPCLPPSTIPGPFVCAPGRFSKPRPAEPHTTLRILSPFDTLRLIPLLIKPSLHPSCFLRQTLHICPRSRHLHSTTPDTDVTSIQPRIPLPFVSDRNGPRFHHERECLTLVS
ncbi:hypothetical protein CC79DRAFT_520971 [Sarocladium strictum]